MSTIFYSSIYSEVIANVFIGKEVIANDINGLGAPGSLIKIPLKGMPHLVDFFTSKKTCPPCAFYYE